MNQIAPLDDSSIIRVREDGATVISDDFLLKLAGVSAGQKSKGDLPRGRRELSIMLTPYRDHQVASGPTEKPAAVRIATAKDEKALYDLLCVDLEENAVKIAPIHPQSVIDVISACTTRKAGIAGVIDGPGGKPVALILITFQKWWWSNAWFLQDTVTCVHPDHRTSHHIDALMAFSKWASDEMTRNAGYRIYLLCGILGVKRVWAKIGLYRRKFAQAGIFCVYPSPFDAGGEP